MEKEQEGMEYREGRRDERGKERVSVLIHIPTFSFSILISSFFIFLFFFGNYQGQ